MNSLPLLVDPIDTRDKNKYSLRRPKTVQKIEIDKRESLHHGRNTNVGSL